MRPVVATHDQRGRLTVVHVEVVGRDLATKDLPGLLIAAERNLDVGADRQDVLIGQPKVQGRLPAGTDVGIVKGEGERVRQVEVLLDGHLADTLELPRRQVLPVDLDGIRADEVG